MGVWRREDLWRVRVCGDRGLGGWGFGGDKGLGGIRVWGEMGV